MASRKKPKARHAPAATEIDSLSLMGIAPELRAEAVAAPSTTEPKSSSRFDHPRWPRPAKRTGPPAHGLDAADPALKGYFGIEATDPAEILAEDVQHRLRFYNRGEAAAGVYPPRYGEDEKSAPSPSIDKKKQQK